MGASGGEVDLAIVGNGALGCALALHFSERHPSARVAVIGPSRRPGSASLAAAAMLQAFAELDATSLETSTGRAKLAIGIEASRCWPEHVALLNRRLEGSGAQPVALRHGTHVLHTGHSSSAGGASFDAIVRALIEYGEPFESVDPSTIEGVAGGPERRALRIPGEGMVSALSLHRAYDAMLARTPGVHVIDGEVGRIDVAGSSKELTTPAGVVRARVVVIAAGARSQELVDRLELGSRIPRLLAGVGVALVLSAPPPRPTMVLRCIGDEASGAPYVVPYDGEHLYVGATNHLMESGITTPPSGAVASLLAGVATHVHPRLPLAPIVRTLVGWRPTTLDTYPLIGPTSIEGIWLATGTRRDGLHLSPRIAEELTRCIGGADLPFAGRFAPERALLAGPTAD